MKKEFTTNKAFLNDKHLNLLYKKLNDLYLKATPKAILISRGKTGIIYDDKFNELIIKFHKEINFRKEQILNYYSKSHKT